MYQKFLYHFVPDNMQGQTLYPLNQLKEVVPEAYDYHLKKYIGRERLLERKVPILDCLWNDVLHLTAVHPTKVTEAMINAGKKVPPKQFYSYEIPVEMILGDKSIVYLYTDIKVPPDSSEYIPFRLEDIGNYSFISQKTIEYYRDCFLNVSKPIVYHFVPHILFKGSIEISGLNIVSNY